MNNKKGSLNLSIQAIVIVVIAFVVLGLGLSFVRGQFKSITETSTGVQEQIRHQILEDLRTGDKKLSFPATTLSIEKGDAQDIAIGVKNTNNAQLKFEIKVEATESQAHPEWTIEQLKDHVSFFYDTSAFTLQTTNAEAYNIKINADGDTGTYLVNLRIMEVDDGGNEITPDAPYAEKSFFVNII